MKAAAVICSEENKQVSFLMPVQPLAYPSTSRHVWLNHQYDIHYSVLEMFIYLHHYSCFNCHVYTHTSNHSFAHTHIHTYSLSFSSSHTHTHSLPLPHAASTDSTSDVLYTIPADTEDKKALLQWAFYESTSLIKRYGDLLEDVNSYLATGTSTVGECVLMVEEEMR